MKNKSLMILIATFTIQFVVFTVASNLMPVLQPTITELHNFDVKSFSLIYTIGVIFSAFASPFIPKFYEKLGLKMSFVLGVVLSGGAFLAMAFATNISMFWLLAAVFNIGTAFVSSIGIPYVISSWYPESEKGSKLGIAFAGGSLGNIVAMVIFNFVNPSTDNINTIIMVAGIISIAVGVLVSLFFISKPSEEESKLIHNDSTKSDEDQVEKTGFTLKEAVKNPYYWMFVVGLIFLGLYVSGMATQYPTYYKKEIEGGADIYLKIGLIFAIASVLGNFIGGFLFDKIGAKKTLVFGLFLALSAGLFLIASPSIPELGYAFAIAKGISVFTYIILPGYLVGYLFGNKDYGSILGISQMFFALGFAFGSFLMGNLTDKLGWHTAWIIIVVFVIICYGCFIVSTIALEKIKKANVQN